MELYAGKSCAEWYNLYKSEGMAALQALEDNETIRVLGRCCVGRESIIPILKEEGWSLERLIAAQRGVDPESLELFAGQYLALNDIREDSLMRSVEYIQGLPIRTLQERGRKALGRL